MKIEKLITLSQFVHNQHTGTGLIEKLAHMYIDCYKYNNFLKQPPTKEMSINPLSKPDDKDDYYRDASGLIYELFHQDSMRFEEAENKVMFKDCQLFSSNNYCSVIMMDNYGISFFNDGRILLRDLDSEKEYWIKTLHDLAEATNGELKTKNLNI